MSTPSDPGRRSSGKDPSGIRAALARVLATRTGRVLYLLTLFVLISSMLSLAPSPENPERPEPLTLAQLELAITAGEVRTAEIASGGGDVRVTLVSHAQDTEPVKVNLPPQYAAGLASRFLEAGVELTVSDPDNPTALDRILSALISVLPLLLLFGFLFFMLRRSMPGQLRATVRKPAETPAVSFQDVAGAAEVTDELAEAVAYLRDPASLDRFGARVPRGVLLVGPPGTGKTLLARAVAGEAGVPFFSVSGSEFAELFVGMGPKRVRELFAQARQSAPCIVFIDEIDALGRARGSVVSGGADEREATLNQLLVEMDGFSSSDQVLVIAATNRADVLDAALLRPGRFDRRIQVPLPDRASRLRILEVHTRNKPLAASASLDAIARRTPGFSGADLAELVNQAALNAARRDGATEITGDDFDEATARVAMGPERRSMVVPDRDRNITAWHEAGHAAVAYLTPGAPRPVSVSIVPRGVAGGVTWLEGSDSVLVTASALRAQLTVALAGRAGEELLLGADVTAGAADDFRKATEIARRLVTELGLSSVGEGFFDRSGVWSDELANEAVAAIRAELSSAKSRASSLLESNRGFFDAIVTELLEQETLSRERIVALAENHGVFVPAEP